MDDDEMRRWVDQQEVVEMDLPELNDEQTGQVVLRPVGGEWSLLMVRKADLPSAMAEAFDAWARDRAYMAMVHGPEVDGWFRRQGDGGWQITGRLVDMPHDPFL